MAKYTQGQMVRLKSDPSIEGAVINVLEGSAEIRYQVFTGVLGLQVYYESQLEAKEIQTELKQVDPAQFHAGLTASLIRNPSLSSLYSLNSARIDFIPHQFRPVLKFIKSDRPRLLIADGVGVGKTIEAGLILREMKARRNLESVLVICPRPLVTEQKWESEMKRFDEDFDYLNGERLRLCIKETDYEGEWPDKYKKAVLPYSLFDEANVMGGKTGRKTHMGLMQLDPPPKFDLVIVDEAHHIRNTATYAYRAVKQFCDNAEAVVFLTATPVQLEYDELFVMLNLLRPDLIIDKDTFHNMAEPNAFINHSAALVRAQKENWQEEALEELEKACQTTQWGKLVISKNPVAISALQTLRQTSVSQEERVRLITDIESLHTFSNIISRTRRRDIGQFTLRKATTVEVPFSREQRILHDEILNIMHEMLSAIHCTDNTKFMMTTIRRQVASCLFGLVPMLEDILYRHVEELVDDEYISGGILQGEKQGRSIEHRIQDIIQLARLLPPDDPKLNKLLEILDDKRRQQKNKVMIFSSFKHTLRYLYKKLLEKGYRVGMVHGEVPDEERRQLRDRFMEDKDKEHALDILLFSEVGCEGLDYQFCDCMINYDLPWNPMRVEQRIGRIDRNGQTSESVSIFNMVTPGTVDFDIYDRCLNRIGVFRQSIGDCEEILGSMSSEIRSIVENFKMTEEEKQEKLQQLADNKIRLLQEQLLLEEKQRDLFGIKVPDLSFDEELENATNYWLSPECLANLVHTYLKQRLDPRKEYLLGDKPLKTLRISKEARAALLDDYQKYKIPNNAENRSWVKLLKQGDLHVQVTFDGNCSRENPKAVLITMSHPLVRQAAFSLEAENHSVTAFRVNSNRMKPGTYPFAVFQWKMSGEREDLQLKPISAYPELNKCLLDLLKESQNAEKTVTTDPATWDEVEKLHHHMWEEELENHRQRTKELIRYKAGSLTTSHEARMAQLAEQLEKATNTRIRTMKEGEIRNAIADYELHMTDLEQSLERADILPETLSYGMLFIEPAQELPLDSGKDNAALAGLSRKKDVQPAGSSEKDRRNSPDLDSEPVPAFSSYSDLKEVMEEICRHYGQEIIRTPRKLISILELHAPQFSEDCGRFKKMHEIGVFDCLNRESGPDVDGAFDIMNTELGYGEAEAEQVLQALEPFYV